MIACLRLTITLFALQLFLISTQTLSAKSALWGDLTPGPYKVGFRVLYTLDSSRNGPSGETGRPIQISLWYPADSTGQVSRLTYRDYFLLSASELAGSEPGPKQKSDALSRYKELLSSNGIPSEAVDRWMSSPMEACLASQPAPGTFPLVLVAQGNMLSAHHQAILCEFLASHGMIVATCPSQTRISGPMASDTNVASSAIEQSQDLAFVARTAIQMHSVDTASIGLLGHSFGARSALLFAAQHSGVRAFVSLDGGIGTRQANDFWRRIPGFVPERIRTALLHFYEETDPSMEPDFKLIESMTRADRYLVKVDGLRHLDFTSLGMVAATIPGFMKSESADSTRKRSLKKACASVYEVTQDFLSSYLSKRPVRGSGRTLNIPPVIMHARHVRPGEK